MITLFFMKKPGGNLQGFTLFQIILEIWSKAPLIRAQSKTKHFVKLVTKRLGLVSLITGLEIEWMSFCVCGHIICVIVYIRTFQVKYDTKCLMQKTCVDMHGDRQDGVFLRSEIFHFRFNETLKVFRLIFYKKISQQFIA